MLRSAVRFLTARAPLDELVTERAGPGDDELKLGAGRGRAFGHRHQGVEALLLLKAAEGRDQHRVLARPDPRRNSLSCSVAGCANAAGGRPG